MLAEIFFNRLDDGQYEYAIFTTEGERHKKGVVRNSTELQEIVQSLQSGDKFEGCDTLGDDVKVVNSPIPVYSQLLRVDAGSVVEKYLTHVQYRKSHPTRD